MRAFVIDDGSSTRAQSKHLLGVHAVLRSKNTLTPQTLLEVLRVMPEEEMTETLLNPEPAMGSLFE
jgi:hypothetical protein